MNDFPELVTNTIWRYYWEERKKGFLKDIKNRNHKLLINDNFDDNALLLFARSFNHLRIMSGMGGLSYAN
jgi:hypothetical protein